MGTNDMERENQMLGWVFPASWETLPFLTVELEAL